MESNKMNSDVIRLLESVRYRNIHIPFCKRVDQKSPYWILTPHAHPYLEMIYFLSGNAHIVVDQKEITASIFDVVVYLPHHIHRETVDLQMEQKVYCVWLDVGEVPFDGMRSFKVCDVNGTLRWLFEQLYAECHLNAPHDMSIAHDYISAILGHFIRSLSEPTLQDKQARWYDIQSYIQQNLSAPMSTQNLAQMYNISPSYLHRIFKKEAATTPTQYINDLRIQTAQILIRKTDYPIHEIAGFVGFTDASYFSRVFKRMVCQTPQEYRNSG